MEDNRNITDSGACRAGVRINKYLSECGVCSRRRADALVEEGRVFINGRPAAAGARVLEGDKVEVDKKRISKQREMVLLAFNKPAGVECTTDHSNPDNIVDYIGFESRIFPIGRLDKASTGLILLTNAGELSDKILRSTNFHEKEYNVRVNRPVTEQFIKKMEKGVPVLDTVTRPCRVKKTGKYTFSIILTQGLNRQIRRMCEYLGYEVVRLKRVRIMNIKLDGLESGKYRFVTGPELEELLREIG